MISDKKPREHIQGKKETTQVRIKPRERMSHKPKVEMTNIYKMSKKSQIILKKKKVSTGLDSTEASISSAY